MRLIETVILCAVSLPPGSAFASARQELRIDNPNGKPITVAVWLPHMASSGNATLHPLVLVSHGNGGGLAAHADTAEALAANGYIVVALAHPGDTKGDDRDLPRKWLAERVGHVGRVLDYMETRWDGRAMVDPSRIGVFGFSAGGFTMLVASGASPSAALARTHCKRASAEFACGLKLDGELARLAWDATASDPWSHDDRIKAAVIAAPALGSAFDREGLSRLRIPIQIWAAERDDRAPASTNTAVLVDNLPTSADYHLVEGADHFAFARPCLPGDQNRRSCKASDGFDRAAFHKRFNREIVEFFNRSLDVSLER